MWITSLRVTLRRLMLVPVPIKMGNFGSRHLYVEDVGMPGKVAFDCRPRQRRHGNGTGQGREARPPLARAVTRPVRCPTARRMRHAAHAELLRQAGDHVAAAGAYRQATALSTNAVERAELRRRLRGLSP